MKKIISFSLWGNNPKYTIGAIRNAELSKTIYPEWICRFYVNDIPEIILRNLQSLDVEIKQEPAKPSWTSMFWRHQTCWDDTVDVSIFRDTDSRLNQREKMAVDEWINSDKTFHIMRDHPFHRFHMLGGMWGYKKNPKYNMKKIFESFTPSDQYGTDYVFFSNALFPIIANDKITHDEFFENKPFPTKRTNNEFVGEVYDEQDNRHPEHYKYIRNE